MIRVSLRCRVMMLMGLVLGLAFNRTGLAAEFFTLDGANPTLYFHDTAGTQRIWDMSGTDQGFYIRSNLLNEFPFFIAADAKNYGLNCMSTGVSVGNVFPARNLHVHGGTNSPIVRLSSDDGGIRYSWDIEGGPVGFKLIDNPDGDARTTFRVNFGAPADSLAVSGDGDIGMGTNNPQARLHISPVNQYHANLRLETPAGGGGIPNQAWDLAGNAGGFSLTDVTNSMKQPFSVAPNTPTYTLHLAANGSVGSGTSQPKTIGASTFAGAGRYFNVLANGAGETANGIFQGQAGAQNHFVHLGAPANQRIMRLQTSSGFTGFHVLNDVLSPPSYAIANVISMKMSNGNVGLKVQNPAHPLHLASGAHVTAGGVFTNASSRELKQDIAPITSEQAREAVRKLQPVGYRYKEELDEQYVGFIAEDVPDLVATKDRKSLAPMDITAVLTKVVQDQERQLEEERRINSQQRAALAEQQDINKRQQELLETLNRRLTDLEKANRPDRD